VRDAALIEDPPQSDPEKFASYQEKQELYQRDLQELPDAERVEKIKEFRESYFFIRPNRQTGTGDAQLETTKKGKPIIMPGERNNE